MLLVSVLKWMSDGDGDGDANADANENESVNDEKKM